jgi:hypothetical protein
MLDMEIFTIERKKFPILVRHMKVSELDKSKCSNKFLSKNLDSEEFVFVKCFRDGTLDLRGKKAEYRIIKTDSL